MLLVLCTRACHATPATRRSTDSISPKQSPHHLEPTFNRQCAEHGGWTSGHSADTGGHSPRRRLRDERRNLETHGDWAASKYAGHGPWARAPYRHPYLPSALWCPAIHQRSITAAIQPQPDAALLRRGVTRNPDGA